MGGFDPTSLLNFLKGSQGDASGLQQTNGLDSSLMNGPSSPAPAPQPQTPQLSPQSQGIKGYLSSIFYDMGEAAKKHVGIPTDFEKQQAQQRLNIQQQQVDQQGQ